MKLALLVDVPQRRTYQMHLRRSELQMTETELRAMAAEAIHGSMETPTGENTPAAIGRPAVEEYTKLLSIFIHANVIGHCESI